MTKRSRIFAPAKSKKATHKNDSIMQTTIDFSLLSDAVRSEMMALIDDLGLELVPQLETL